MPSTRTGHLLSDGLPSSDSTSVAAAAHIVTAVAPARFMAQPLIKLLLVASKIANFPPSSKNLMASACIAVQSVFAAGPDVQTCCPASSLACSEVQHHTTLQAVQIPVRLSPKQSWPSFPLRPYFAIWLHRASIATCPTNMKI